MRYGSTHITHNSTLILYQTQEWFKHNAERKKSTTERFGFESNH